MGATDWPWQVNVAGEGREYRRTRRREIDDDPAIRRVNLADAADVKFGGDLLDSVARCDGKNGALVDRPTRGDASQCRLDLRQKPDHFRTRESVVWKTDERHVIPAEFVHIHRHKTAGARVRWGERRIDWAEPVGCRLSFRTQFAGRGGGGVSGTGRPAQERSGRGAGCRRVSSYQRTDTDE